MVTSSVAPRFVDHEAVEHSVLTAEIDVARIPWGHWGYWTDSMQCSSYCGVDSPSPSHFLVELGGTTANYRYSVYYKRSTLFSKVIRLDCCNDLFKCPIKHYTLPMSPCREHLRLQAQEAAYQIWVEFITSLAGAAPITQLEGEQ